MSTEATVTMSLSSYDHTQQNLELAWRDMDKLRARVTELEKERDELKDQIACDRFSLAMKEFADALRQSQETWREVAREELHRSGISDRLDELIRQGRELITPADGAAFDTLMSMKPKEAEGSA